jgi:predicted nucleic acid-binding protein
MSADFFDSNVMLYLFDQDAATKRNRARDLVKQGLDDRSACISYQVVQETLNVLSRKNALASGPSQTAEFLHRTLMPLCTVLPSEALYSKALSLQLRWRFSFYDSLIVAAALEAGCKRLLSEDMQHGQRIEGLRIENPFRA